MYGLLVPAGVDPATVEALERFAEHVVCALPGTYREGAQEYDIDELMTDTLQEFLREEVGRGVAAGATALQRPARRARRGRKA